MKKWIGAVMAASAVVLTGTALTQPVVAAPQPTAIEKSDTGKATDFSAQRYYRRYNYRPHYGYGYRPRYYARPYYYRPYPYDAPAPFPFGLGFGFGRFGW